MELRDLGRYAALLVGFCLLEIPFALLIGTEPRPFFEIQLGAALCTILWAVRESKQ